MVESAGGRGRAGPGPPLARPPAGRPAAAVNFPQRARPASPRTAPPAPRGAGKEPWFPGAQE